MFDKIVLRTSEEGPALTAGQVAELSLFYQNVHLILDFRNLKGLIEGASPSSLLSFLGRGNITATYFLDFPGTHTAGIGPIKTHNFISTRYAGSETKGRIWGFKDRITDTFEEAGCTKKEAKDYSHQFCELVSSQTLSDENIIQGGILEASKQILNNADYISEAVRLALKEITGELILPKDLEFHVIQSDEGFKIFSNIDFEEVTRIHKSLDPNASDVTQASLINNVLTTESDMLLASYYGGEFVTSKTDSTLINFRYKSLLSSPEKKQREGFLDVISEGRSIGEVIDSGEKTFDEYMNLLDEAEKFKEWIKDKPPEENLIKEYLKEVSNQGWAEKLPIKLIRYAASFYAGAADLTAGGVVSAIDSFLIDRISTGWKPNHFVEGPLKKFTEEKG